MRAAFQARPEVAHVYLGSKRHTLERIFNDENEPFWRSAKHMELGVIEAEAFAPFTAERFTTTGRSIRSCPTSSGVKRSAGGAVTTDTAERGLDRVLRSEHAHFSRIWEAAPRAQRLLLQALAHRVGRPLTSECRRRHDLPGPSATQRALEHLERRELVGRNAGEAWIAEPFLAAWIRKLA